MTSVACTAPHGMIIQHIEVSLQQTQAHTRPENDSTYWKKLGP